MIIYMAGGISGNLNPMWRITSAALKKGVDYESAFDKAMEIFMAGGGESTFCDRRTPKKKITMDIFLAGQNGLHRMVSECSCILPESPRGETGGGYDQTIKDFAPKILESFYYCDEDTERLLPYYGDFLLDSGAFTFMQGNHKGEIRWEDYIERYCNFILKNNIKAFFELDIDVVVGYSKVKEYRRMIEKLTGRQPIPVWHISRGAQEFQRMCDEYPRVAIGGIVSGEITKDKYMIFPAMIKEAHRRGAKIHGLGFTNLTMLKTCKFDSVDSTAWTTGNRFGFLYKFNGETMVKIDCPKGSRIVKSREAALNNFVEWLKFQKYAETHL